MGVFTDIEHRSFEQTLAACAARGGVDLVLTSPPYPDARPGQYGGDASHDFTWPDYQRLGDAVALALRPGGFAAINIDGPVRTTRPGVGSERSLIAFKLAIDWAERVGLRYVEHCAYAREGAPGRFGDRWRSGWEPVHLFQRPGPSAANVGAVLLPALHEGRTYSPRSRRSGGGWRSSTGFKQAGTRQLTTVIASPTGNSYIDISHPAPFSRLLADAFVLCYCPPGGTVCDPFTGSGTVAISCARNARCFIGGDLGVRQADGLRWADIAREEALAILDPAQQSLFSHLRGEAGDA